VGVLERILLQLLRNLLRSHPSKAVPLGSSPEWKSRLRSGELGKSTTAQQKSLAAAKLSSIRRRI